MTKNMPRYAGLIGLCLAFVLPLALIVYLLVSAIDQRLTLTVCAVTLYVFIAFARSLSQRQRAETALREREEALRAAKAAAEVATQAQAAFLARVRHEIRPPMDTVIGMSSLLLDTPLSPDQRECAESIRSSSDELFTILNDMVDFSTIAGATPTPVEPQLDTAMAQRRPLRILLAEDHVVHQQVALRLLQQMGYRADVAGNGLEVLTALEHQPYDVVLMDVQMPEMDGLTAARAICQRWSRPQRPWIIAMTANTWQDDRERCLEAGMDDYVSKPIRVAEFVAALHRYEPDHALESQEMVAPVQTSGSPGAPAETRAAASTPGVLDLAILERLRTTMGADVFAELLDAFLADTPPLVTSLRQALTEGDAKALRRAAHTLKTNSASFGALPLALCCKALEDMGRVGILDGATARVTQVEAEYSKVQTTLEAMRTTGSGT